jgi:hypothetical protein
MTFYFALFLINVCCFLPVYLLNIRNQSNPFGFVALCVDLKSFIKIFYVKHRQTDPFKVNFEFTFLALILTATDQMPVWLEWSAALLLAFGFIEVLYTATLYSIFGRPPSFASDLSLLKAGINLAQKNAYWILPLVLALIAGITFASYEATALLLDRRPVGAILPLILAASIVAPCAFHLRRYPYAQYPFRTVYSPILHFYLNLKHGKRLQSVIAKDRGFFERRNHFKNVVLERPPSVVVICIESYGDRAFLDERIHPAVDDLLVDYAATLADHGYIVASNLSAAPIFAGGSWLSYASFTYGTRLDDLHVFEGLFSLDSPFLCYESLFHVLKRNGYTNYLLCPLGGIDVATVDWKLIDRCFLSDRNIDFSQLNYEGPRYNYFGAIRRHAAPDQYALNFAFDEIERSGSWPFCLFFCTLNSHYPWDSPARAAENWRDLNRPGIRPATGAKGASLVERYRDAIRYQLDYILRFVIDHHNDDVLFVLFGDHQPPFIAPSGSGPCTPVHVITKEPTVARAFYEHGFLPGMDLSHGAANPIVHEGFLSLLMKAMQSAYGASPELPIEYRAAGVVLFDEQ